MNMNITNSNIPRRTFIVGAGVSAECGAPTLANFLHPKFTGSVNKQWLDDVQRLTSVVYTKNASPNIEMILSVVDHALARRESIGGLTQADLARIRSSILNIITEVLIQSDFNLRKELGLKASFQNPHVLLDSKWDQKGQETLNPRDPLCKLQFGDLVGDPSGFAVGYRDTYFRLVRCLNSGEHVITLNYDLFLDYALESQMYYQEISASEESPLPVSPFYGIENYHELPRVYATYPEGNKMVGICGVEKEKSNLRIGAIKLHGALNLGTCSACKAPFITGVLPVKCAMEYLNAGGIHVDCCGDADPQMLIVPPSWSKDYTSQVLEEMFRAGINAISNSSEIVFLGYSFAESDYQIRYMFNRALGYRRGKPWEKVVVVDPMIEYTKATYERFFGNIDAHKEKASDYIKTLEERWL